MILVTTIVTLYTLMGGLWADTALDFMQMFLTSIGLVIFIAGIAISVGGLGNMLIWQVRNIRPIHLRSGRLQKMDIMDISVFMAGSITLQPGLHSVWEPFLLRIICNEPVLQRMKISLLKPLSLLELYILRFGVLSPLIGVAAYGALGPELAGMELENTLILMAMKYLPPILGGSLCGSTSLRSDEYFRQLFIGRRDHVY